MRGYGSALALALLLWPGVLGGQQGGAAPAGTGPIDRLLQRRAELALTAQQVAQLEAIRQETAAQEQALAQKIAAAGLPAPGVPVRTQAATPAERQALRQKRAANPQMVELRQLHLKQIQRARAVLTPEQNARAWAAGCGGRGPGMRAGRGAGLGMGMRAGRGGGIMGRGAGLGCGWGAGAGAGAGVGQ